MIEKKQKDIWLKRSLNFTVNDIVNNYRNPAIFQIELKELLNRYCEPKKKICEVGCEAGVTTMILDESFDKHLIDLNPEAIKLSKQAFSVIGIKGKHIVADMFNIPFEPKYFDIVFNAGVLEHFSFYERKNALKEYARVIKDDGSIVVAFPNHYSIPYRLAYMIRVFLGKWAYPKEYKIYDLSSEIKDCGLILIQRIVISKSSVMKWLNFSTLLRIIFEVLDMVFNFEGYLTVCIIRKNHDT